MKRVKMTSRKVKFGDYSLVLERTNDIGKGLKLKIFRKDTKSPLGCLKVAEIHDEQSYKDDYPINDVYFEGIISSSDYDKLAIDIWDIDTNGDSDIGFAKRVRSHELFLQK